MEEKVQNMYLTNYNLLIAQDLWQVHYQILPIIFLKEFIKLNVDRDTLIRNLKPELNVNIATVFLNKPILKMIQQNTNVCIVTKTIN